MSMNILIIGGTRNMGHLLAVALHDAGHQVAVFNRGITPDELPEDIRRIRGDRYNAADLRAALATGPYDAVVDMVLYNGEAAQQMVALLAGQVGHYIFISTGQVYLVREGLQRPFTEAEYAGALIPPPKDNTYAYEEWRYGMGKRDAEDVLAAAWQDQHFPYTSLRLPMVNGEREPSNRMNRLYGYVLRIKDGGPILVPQTPDYPLRHVYAGDVVNSIVMLLESGLGKGQAYNISQDETVTLDEFTALLADVMGYPAPLLVRIKRSVLDANGFLPDCSPFSDRWMSELENTRSKTELGMVYTPLRDYLTSIVQHYRASQPAKPAGYKRRSSELYFAQTLPAEQMIDE